VTSAGERTWKGRTRPRTGVAIVVYTAAGALLAAAFVRGDLQELGDRWPFAVLLVAGALSYGILIARSWAEVELTLTGGRMRVVVREGLLSQTREGIHVVDRRDMAKVRERVVRGLVHNVFVEGPDGRRLCAFPRFLDMGQHDEMVHDVVVWGGRS
jgi:hypothetical protein